MKKEIQKMNPMSDLFDLRREIDSIFDSRFPSSIFERYLKDSSWMPALDIEETEKDFIAKIELPGIKKEDISLKVENNILTIQGERKSESEENGKTYHRIERSYGKFYRSISLPKHIDEEGIKASCEDGVLRIVMPKSKNSNKKTIQIDG